jgi:hypothetical protein
MVKTMKSLELLPVLRIIDRTIGAIGSCKMASKSRNKMICKQQRKTIKGFNSLLVKKKVKVNK